MKTLRQIRLLGQQDEATWKVWLAWLVSHPKTVNRLIGHARLRWSGSILGNLKEIKRCARQLAENTGLDLA